MYYGQEQSMYCDVEPQMYNWLQDGTEIVSNAFDTDPSFFEFAGSQFERFGIPITQKCAEELFATVARALTYVYAYHEPYLLFWDCSDVDITNEWREYSYEIVDHTDSEYSHEADPQMLETYQYSQGKDEVFFNAHLQMPGLKALPAHIYEALDIIIDDITTDALPLHRHYCNPFWESPLEGLSSEAENELKDLCSVIDTDGNVRIDGDKVRGYYEITLWSAILWSMGPLGRRWRYSSIDIFRLCYDHGSCILYEGLLYSPDFYTTIMRPPKSCHICGVHAWCVEFTQDGDATRYVCEGCLNGAFSKPGSGRCGTKKCHHVQCPNHPDHTMDEYGYLKHLSGHGQLRGLAGNKPNFNLFGSESKKLLR